MSELFEALGLFTTNAGGRSCLEVGGEIDLATVDALRDHLDLLVASGTGDVDVDMAAVTFGDATVLHVLLPAHQTLNAAGRHIHVINPSSPINRLLRLTGLDTTFLAPPRHQHATCRSRPTPPSGGEGSQDEATTDADRRPPHRPSS